MNLTGNERIGILSQNPAAVPAAQTFDVSTAHLAGAGASASTTQLDITASTALVNIPNLTANILKTGTYRFRASLPGTANTAGGVRVALSYTSATLTSLSIASKVFTASGVAVAYTSTTASQTSLASSTSAGILTEIEGTMVIAALDPLGGNFALQFAQSASTAATSSVYAGANMQFVKIT